MELGDSPGAREAIFGLPEPRVTFVITIVEKQLKGAIGYGKIYRNTGVYG
jgi:hypothetical protein